MRFTELGTLPRANMWCPRAGRRPVRQDGHDVGQMDMPAQDQVHAGPGPGRQRALAPEQQVVHVGLDLGPHRMMGHHHPQLPGPGLPQPLLDTRDLGLGDFSVLATPRPGGVHADGQQAGVSNTGSSTAPSARL